MADLTNVDEIQAATEEGNLKWYVDNDSAGSWRRTSFEDAMTKPPLYTPSSKGRTLR